MSVERLISALWTEAELKERAIMDEAQDMIGKIASAGEEAAARLNAQVENRKKHLAMREAALGSAHEIMRKRKVELYAVAGAMESVRGAAGVLFREFMKSPAYTAYLMREIESVKKESGAIAQIRADSVTAETLRKVGVPNVVEDVTAPNGFVAVMADGKTRVFCLLDTRLAKFWKDSAPRLVAQISEAATRGD
jgi:vacuolar-type H+-ATPase subunit E/Vma4